MIGTFASLVALAGVIAGCGTTSNSPNPTNSGASPTTGTGALAGSASEKYEMVTFLSGIDYWKGAYKGMQDAAKLFGVTTVYTGASNYDINQEVTVLNQVIAQKPAGILLTCINPDALKPSIDKAISEGIPVVTFDSDSPDSNRYSFLATSNYEAGVIAADTLAKLTGGTGDVAILVTPGQLNLQQRAQGFTDTIKQKYPNMHIVAVENGKENQIQSASVTSAILSAHPNLVGIFGTDANAGVGIATAIKEANKVGKVHIVSFDTDKATLDLVKSGVIDATLAQGTWNMGYWGMQFLFELHHNLLHPVSDWKAAHIPPLPPNVDTGVSVVTKQNVDFYYSN
ncbi:substrate-binding domain-containing protein [Alicyclobacillus macrosporangiidus]|uniref:substrate-binding domain-containing protein n=1 Tax=Alicyclobacillus macrosporangiidus TaxID=392015 RepID=UPI0026E9332D|nr:substrate-binding domain-containing protein [Alicyclobacillus macrosporangiidus]